MIDELTLINIYMKYQYLIYQFEFLDIYIGLVGKLSFNPKFFFIIIMALAKDPICSLQTSSFNYGNFDEGGDDHLKKLGGGVNNFPMTSSSSFSSPCSVDSEGFVFWPPHEEVHSLINFKGSSRYGTHQYHHHGTNYGSLLSFEQNEKAPQSDTYLKRASHKDNYSMWDPRLVEDFSCFETASNFSSKENKGDWLYSESATDADSVPELRSPGVAGVKRLNTVPFLLFRFKPSN